MTIDDDRRTGIDRRRIDLILLFQDERRCSADPRKPEVDVEELPEACWEMYFNNPSGNIEAGIRDDVCI